MKNGFIYPFFDGLIRFLNHFNAVEWFKHTFNYIFIKIFNFDTSKKREIQNIAIDSYQLFKWSILILFWRLEAQSNLSLYLIYYLIFSNLFSYSYYHVWNNKSQSANSRERENRRFLFSILAILYYLSCYAYLYQFHYYNLISWPDNIIDKYNAFYLSVANAFTLTYGGFSPLDQSIRMVFLSELFNTFIFFTIIVSNSIPTIREIKERG